MEMRTRWRIQADLRYQGYDVPDWVQKTSVWCYFSWDRDTYQLYRGWSIDSHKKFCRVPISHDNFPHLL